MLNGINHITVSVKDLEESFSFYNNVLGLKPLLRHSKGAYFLAGDLWFCLDLDPATKREPLPEYTHFAFDVNEVHFHTVKNQIISSGAKVWKENKSEGESLYFLDPDGHKLEIHVGDWKSRLAAAKASSWGENVEFFV